jgi:asparagine synthase (glutamine-hydrolysing)
MCGIACYLGRNKEESLRFGGNARSLLKHRGPDDNGMYTDDLVTLSHTRLSILELSELGHQPMNSSCGRYVIIFNGEIYNHLDLRKKYLPEFPFRGHSDTETIIELFRIQKEEMLLKMIGMWSIIIWDKTENKLFISRSRLGQKPLYIRHKDKSWMLASEIKPLLSVNEIPAVDPTAVIEYMALGNYGHLGAHTFFADISLFPEGSYAWLCEGQQEIDIKKFWILPDIRPRDKVPFDSRIKNELHDAIIEAILSVTLSDVPIGLTLSGGVDSSIIAGVLACYYDKEVHIFTAQSPHSKFDETRYVDAVINRYSKSSFIIHRKNLNDVSIKNNLEKFINIQEEPFGDPSIIAHGFLMNIAADSGIKVILNGQGADELFYGYNNMAQAILSFQLKSLQFSKFTRNLGAMKLGADYFMRTLLKTFFPTLEATLRKQSRIKRRDIIQPHLLEKVENELVTLYKYNNIYDVWRESMYGVHMPHLVHYDDRNAMANSIEGRMPFLDNRIAELVACIRPDDFLKNGMRKYILRESCRQYLPEIVYNRKDKIGFYTPLLNMLASDATWVTEQMRCSKLLTESHNNLLINKLKRKTLNINEALQIWRNISVNIWMRDFQINSKF